MPQQKTLLPLPPPPAQRQALPQTLPNQPARAKVIDAGLQALMGLLGLADPLRPEGTPAEGVGSVIGMFGPAAVMGSLKGLKKVRAVPTSSAKQIQSNYDLLSFVGRRKPRLMNAHDPMDSWAVDTIQYADDDMLEALRGAQPFADTAEERKAIMDALRQLGGPERMRQRYASTGSFYPTRVQLDPGSLDAELYRPINQTLPAGHPDLPIKLNKDVIEILRKYGILPPLAAATANEAVKKDR